MNPDALGEPHVDARVGVIDVPVPRSDQRDREIAHLFLGQAPARFGARAAATVDVQAARGADEEVGHTRVLEHTVERAHHLGRGRLGAHDRRRRRDGDRGTRSLHRNRARLASTSDDERSGHAPTVERP